MLIHRSPTVLRLSGYESKRAELAKYLTYVDKKVDYELDSHKRNKVWFTQARGSAAYALRLEELKAKRNQSLLFEDAEGLWTYSGLSGMLASAFGDEVVYEYQRPAPKALPWVHLPENKDRYFQAAAAERLLGVGHGAVEIGTGLGKSQIIRNLVKALGLQTVVMAPSKNIASQILADLTKHFGKAKVGRFFGGKKEFKKQIVVAVAASLTRVEPGSQEWDRLVGTKVFIADESHLCPASTLAKVCFGLLADAPYRFFFSGTQMRNDGLDLLLDAITGPIVYRMTVREGVDQGFLTKPVFKMIRTKSGINFDSHDANELTRVHLYYNPKINKMAADFANKAVSLMARPTLILVDEIEQFSHLLPHLRYEARFAHGGVNKDNKDKLPAEYHDSDPDQLVADFNDNAFPILVGTSCISTGTDIRSVRAIIYLRGGKSEVELKQSVGRGTRLFAGKEDFLFIDFAIDDVDMLARHAEARISIFRDIYPSFSEIRM